MIERSEAPQSVGRAEVTRSELQSSERSTDDAWSKLRLREAERGKGVQKRVDGGGRTACAPHARSTAQSKADGTSCHRCNTTAERGARGARSREDRAERKTPRASATDHTHIARENESDRVVAQTETEAGGRARHGTQG